MYFDILFYLFSAITVIATLFVVFSRNVVHSAFALLFTFLGVAGLYVLLNADFLAVVQIMVYVGGILVLLIFGVMLTNRASNLAVDGEGVRGWAATAIVGVLLASLIALMTRVEWFTVPSMPDAAGTTMEIGELLLTSFLLPFEVAGLLLLVAIMGAAMIARKDAGKEESA